MILRVAAKVAIVSRCAPGHRRPRPARDEPRRPARRPRTGRAARTASASATDFPVAALGHEQRAVIGGDAKSAAIAAASVIAKETRDRYMRRADRAHPGWEFAQHVGYATPEHRDAIERLGVSPLHRLSFQSAAYQQLASVSRSRDSSERPLQVLDARPAARRGRTSRRSRRSAACRRRAGRCARSASSRPSCRTRARLRPADRVERGPAARRASRRVLTSQNASVRPSNATMSSSPQRVR